jgi:hypothetical protein
MENEKLDLPFYQLVLSLQAATMQQLGKVISPITGKAEKDLTMAKGTIDLLEMFQRKTTGNLDDDEKKLLEHVLYELRLNYVDELNKESASPAEGKAPTTDGETAH